MAALRCLGGRVAEFLQFLFSGLTIGAIYALVALGFTLIYNASDVINFAQGEFVMIGGMVTFFALAAGVPLPLRCFLQSPRPCWSGSASTASRSSRRATPPR
jgi:branched-subunit amino acid ABC-type transport system permease component